MRVAMHQPNYAPWCGYFAKMRACDIFIFLDDVQMSKGSYIYRCRVRGRAGGHWLSIPTDYRFGSNIIDVRFAKMKWKQKHLGTLRALYGRSPCFKEVFAFIEPLYLEPTDTLAEFNIRMIKTIAAYLEIPSRFEKSSSLQPEGQKADRLISLAHLVGADTYVSGKGGQNYQDPIKFTAAGIRLDVHEYRHIPYTFVEGEDVTGLSILDALFHLGRQVNSLLDYPRVVTYET